MAARGAYNTRQRAEILDYLESHRQCRLSVDELVKSLAERGVAVGKTTVYRLLEALALSGAAKKYPGADGATCYQYVADASACQHHSHLVCEGCGDLLHVECDVMKRLASHMLHEHGFALDEERTLLYGRCARCRAEE